MSVQPIPSALPASSWSADRPGSRPEVPAGVGIALVGALLLLLVRSLPIGSGGPSSPWDSWAATALPTLAFPAALLWWTRSPDSAQRLLPVIVGIAFLPAVALALVPTVVGSLPDVVVAVVAVLGSAAVWTVTGLVLICAASLAWSGRTVAAGLAAAVVVLSGLLLPTVFASIRELELPSPVYPLLLLVGAAALIVGGSIIPRPHGERRVVPVPTAVTALLGALTTVVPSLVTYFVLSSGGRGVAMGWSVAVGVVLVLAAVGGAILLGREAVLLVLGAGLLLGGLNGLTASVGAGLGREWWLPLLVVLVLLAATAVATVRAGREIGMSAITVLVVVLVATFLIVEFGHLTEGLEILLTLAGLVAGAIAGASIVAATVPRLVRTDDLVPVVLLTLALGAGVVRLFAWVFEATDSSRNTSLLWICGVLVLAVVAVALWPRSAPGAPGHGAAGTGVGSGPAPADHAGAR